jgi:NAD(P)-dependent dehydrogenase (short-subunit alcohol dehydrogenase family)
VKQAFHWAREALLLPLAPQSTVIAMSSGAALFGSPLSGGYAGAKAAIRFLSGYAADESVRAGLGIRFVSVLPKLTPTTELGAMAVAAYARRDGIEVDEVVRRLGPALGPEHVGKHIADLASSTDHASGAYLLTPDGLSLIA